MPHRTGEEYWIGLYKNEPESYSSAYWLDGSRSTFHINTYLFNEDTHCVRLKYWKNWWTFMDRSCNYNFSYVCKKAVGM